MNENRDKVDYVACKLEDLTNAFGCRTDLESLALKMSHMHRTLVQSFVSGFIVPFVYELAKMKRENRFDGRNAAACEACEAMWMALEGKYDVHSADDLHFACI